MSRGADSPGDDQARASGLARSAGPAPPRSLRRVVVTGATGFIGRALCQALSSSSVEVVAVARTHADGPWERLVAVDLELDPIPADALLGADTVFHLAARVHALDETRPLARALDRVYERANVEGTRRVTAAARAAGVDRLVNFSSVKAMGEGGGYTLSEADAPRPLTAYGRSKLKAEELVANASGPGFETISLRLAMTYGPGGQGN
jgi:nucleoside-diphosphate-sugar epimerase